MEYARGGYVEGSGQEPPSMFEQGCEYLVFSDEFIKRYEYIQKMLDKLNEGDVE
jgi:hypothetical protein